MQSWILAFALVLVASGARAVDTPGIQVPDAVPPIPSPWEPMAPMDGPWPASPAPDGSVVDANGAPVSVPAIPAPDLDGLDHASDERGAAPATGQPLAAAPLDTPAPARMAEGFDPSVGTIHVVEKGDTLWDISDAYLGTPWIWPSVWRDNEEIENPHLILPGDKIWISANEMRKVSDEEAAALLAGSDDDAPAAMSEDLAAVPTPQAPPQYFQYAELPTVGIVRHKELKGMAQVVGTTEEQVNLAQGDVVFIDLGDQDAKVGDHLVMFRTGEKVYDPATRRSLGRHTQVVGWLELIDVYEESAKGLVRMAYHDFVPGVYLKPRETPRQEIEIRPSPQGVEGQLADLRVEPKYLGGGDVVVLNRGSEDGLEVGSPLEVYRPVSDGWKDTWYGRQPDVEIPHDVVAEMIVLSVQPHTAMAYVRKTSHNTELSYGDRFRTVNGPSVEWPESGLFILPRLKGLMASLPKPAMPEVDVPGDWNTPRLLLPILDDYDPR